MPPHVDVPCVELDNNMILAGRFLQLLGGLQLKKDASRFQESIYVKRDHHKVISIIRALPFCRVSRLENEPLQIIHAQIRDDMLAGATFPRNGQGIGHGWALPIFLFTHYTLREQSAQFGGFLNFLAWYNRL